MKRVPERRCDVTAARGETFLFLETLYDLTFIFFLLFPPKSKIIINNSYCCSPTFHSLFLKQVWFGYKRKQVGNTCLIYEQMWRKKVREGREDDTI